MPTIIATYADISNANAAVEALLSEDIPRDKISIATSEDTYSKHLKDYPGGGASEVGDRFAEDILAGGSLGAVAGFFIGLSAILVPAVGPLFVTGPFAASVLVGNTLTGAAIGGSAGAVVGIADGLISAGVSEEQALLVQEAVGRGEVLVSVEDDGSGRALQILEAAGPSSEIIQF